MARSRILLATLLVIPCLACGDADPRREEADSRAPQPSSPRPDVLLVTVDTLRPDALGWVGGNGRTPAIDRLAAEGIRVPDAVTTVPLTLPAHTSLFTGLLPPRHGVRDNGQVVSGGPRLLAEILGEAGWATAAFVSGHPLSASFGLDRGFDHYDDRLTAGAGAWLERPADETTAAALAWVEGAPSPWFVWVHYYDPHYPYDPPEGYPRPGRRGAYDGEVAFVDAAFGKLRRGLSSGEESLLTIFTADHGESLGEHGEGTHGFFVYDSTLLVPLVIHHPGRLEPGEGPDGARLVDLMPTIVDLLELDPPADLDGAGLLAGPRGEPPGSRPAYFETYQPWRSYGWAPLRGVRHGGWKLIDAPRPELYDLGADPQEGRNLIDRRPGRARVLARHLEEVEALPPVGGPGEVADPEALARLRALGYTGAGSPAPGAEVPVGLPDPKERIEARERLTEADELLRGGRHREALTIFRRVLEEEPDNRFALARAGVALLRSGRPGEALEPLGRAVAGNPRDGETRAALAEALTGLGRLEEAVGQWQELLARQPDRVSAWSNLGATLGMAGRPEEAAVALRRAVALAPEDPDRRVRLAFAEHAAGRLDAAAANLLEAAETAADGFAHAGSLGLILLELDRPEEARRWLGASEPGEGDFARARLALARLEARAGRPDAARHALEQALAVRPDLAEIVGTDPDLAGLIR